MDKKLLDVYEKLAAAEEQAKAGKTMDAADGLKKLRGKIPVYDYLTKKQFYSMMETGYQQARNGQTVSVEEAFAEIAEGV